MSELQQDFDVPSKSKLKNAGNLVGPSSLGESRSSVESRRILPPHTGGREEKEAENPGA